MSSWTTLTLVHHGSDRRLVAGLVLVADADDDGRRGRCVAMEPDNCILQFDVTSAAFKRLGVVEEIAAAIEAAPWRVTSAVLLLIMEENDVRPAVWGFAGAHSFGDVEKPRRFVCLVPAVPS